MDTDEVPAELDKPFGTVEQVGQAPQGPLINHPRTGRTRVLGRGLGALLNPPAKSSDLPAPVAETLTGAPFSVGGADQPPPKRTGDPKVTAGIVIGLVGLGLAAASWALHRSGRSLRRPSKDQIRDFARPVGALIARHTDLSWLGDDIKDISEAAAVVTDYASEGPIAPPLERVVQTGMETAPDPAGDGPAWAVGDPTPYSPAPTVTYLQ